MKKIIFWARWLLPISGTSVAILGIAMLFASWESLESVAVLIGIAMVLSGIFELISFFKDRASKQWKIHFATGATAVVLGLITAFGPGIVAVNIVLPVVFAVWIVSASVPRIKAALDKRKEGSPIWVFAFCFGVLGIALGGLLLFHPALSAFVVTYALAFIFISHGANSIIEFYRWNKLEEYT